MTANTTASRKAKGRRFQQEIRDDLISRLGIVPADILSTPMGQAGSDLYLSPAARSRFPFAVECKFQEHATLWPWWEQCVTNAAKEDLMPLLVIRRARTEPLAVLPWYRARLRRGVAPRTCSQACGAVLRRRRRAVS